MALNYEDLLSDVLLELNETKRLGKITVTDIQKSSGISRQTFYNHFVDIFDLIQYTYKKNIVIQWDPYDKNLDFCDYLMEDLSRTMKYHHFLKEALDIHGQNNLKEYMVDYCIDFLQKWMQTYYPGSSMPDTLKYGIIFSASGAMFLKFQWIEEGINRPVFSVAKNIIDGLNRGLTPLFFQNPIDSPLEKAANKIQEIIENNKE